MSRIVLSALLAGVLGLSLSLSHAQEGKSGEQVYRQVCMACHAAKVDRAPQFGDKAAWAPLIAEGQDVLTAHAWVGVRGMPAKGGQTDLSLPEFARAVAYLARAAGGNWQDPDAAMLDRIKREEGKRRAQMQAKSAKD